MRQNLIKWNGEIHNIKEWASISGISREIISYRLKSGLSLDKVFIKDNIKPTKVSLCWSCKNSVPSSQYGCCWSKEFKPVDGWDAIKSQIVINDYSSNIKVKKIESFSVRSCPQFIRDRREPIKKPVKHK